MAMKLKRMFLKKNSDSFYERDIQIGEGAPSRLPWVCRSHAFILYYSKRMKNPPSWGKLYMTKQEREKAKVSPIQQKDASQEASQTATSEESIDIQAG